MPDELMNAVGQAVRHLGEPEFSPSDEAFAQARRTDARRVRRRRRAAYSALGLAAAAAVMLLFGLPREAQVTTDGAFVTSPTALRLSDGSMAQPLVDGSLVSVIADRPELAELTLQKGSARFDVVPNRPRRFRVLAGPVTVEALGTVFTVSEVGTDRVHVAVLRGRVKVEWSGGHTELEKGNDGVYPPVAASIPVEESEPATTDEPPDSETHSIAPAVPRFSWRDAAGRGDVKQAYEALKRDAPVKNAPDDLLLAADVARKSNNPSLAAGYLARIVDEHPGDARAPVAAFTLGRVRLGMGQAAGAAQAFHKARSLKPNGALAHDAWVKEIESLDRAGQRIEARRLARGYLQRYPKGSHAQQFRDLVRGD